jgi:D-amino-acid dehydrogenase
MANNQVTVVGGGIVGLASAWQLAKDGHDVTVVDQGAPTNTTSFVNAGWITPSHIIPLAAPGMVATGMKNLIGRTGAFALSPTAGPGLAPWLTKFASKCTDAHVEHSAPALKELVGLSIDIVNDLIANDGLLRTKGKLWMLYTSENANKEAKHEVEMMEHFGVNAYEIPAESTYAQESILKNNIKAAVEFESDFGVDPRQFNQVFKANCEAAGVKFRNETVVNLTATQTGVTIRSNKDSWTSDYMVLAAGIWSRELAKLVGASLPMMAAKGQSVTLPDIPNMPTHPMMLSDQRITLNPLSWGLRISTGYKLTSSNDLSIEKKAIDKLIARTRTVVDLPESLPVKNELMGMRPASPDGLPYIGALPSNPRVVVATGHNMLGLMMAPGTGRFVADIVAGKPVSREIMKFSPARP